MSLIEINCNTLNDIVWLGAGSFAFTTGSDTDVWKIKVSANDNLLQSFLSIMSPAEIDRGNCFFQLKDKNRHITTRGALRIILSKYLNQNPEDIAFGVTATGKPYLLNNLQQLFFNVSHSGEWILIGIGKYDLGVDVEYIKPAFNYQEIISLNFSLKENGYITENQSLDRFFKLWTRKESLLKATGQGLNNDLSHFSCLDGLNKTESSLIESANNWQISSFKVDENYWGSACADPGAVKLNFITAGFNTTGDIL
jgi:4'-phosphopantetheinyl transferase